MDKLIGFLLLMIYTGIIVAITVISFLIIAEMQRQTACTTVLAPFPVQAQIFSFEGFTLYGVCIP